MTEPTTTPHGMFRQMTDEAYHNGPGISKSHLDDIAISPYHYWGRRLDPEREPEKQTESLIIGDAIHVATLQPDLFAKKFMIMPGFNLRSPKGRALRDEWLDTEAKDADVLTVKQRDLALKCATIIRKHPVASKMLPADGVAEAAFFATDPATGILVKCKTDFYSETFGLITDAKSTDSASEDAFRKSVQDYRYHVQEAWYRDIFELLYGESPPYWVFLAIEKKPPHAIGVYYLEAEDVERGRKLARRDLRRLVQCQESNTWPDFATEAKPLPLAAWYRQKCDSIEA